MPYAMSVIVSRAIPEIDGFKPSQRKLLYTMYKMGLLTGARTKSANIVGQTMRLNPHGDAAIYDTMVRLSKGYGAVLTPFEDSKGNFGKVYSRDMACAASPLYGGEALAHLRRALRRHRQGDRGLRGQLRRHHEGAGAAAHGLPQRPRLRQHGHRRRAWRARYAASTWAKCARRPSSSCATPGTTSCPRSLPRTSPRAGRSSWTAPPWRRYTAQAAAASASARAGAMTKRRTSSRSTSCPTPPRPRP